ncbi:MAG: SDR family oxidoreductase [Candidatus Firestonebacteria bacterium]
MKTMFIVGGTGGIGIAIAEKFKNNGFNVIVPSEQELNFLDGNTIEKYFKGKNFDVDVIINCAGINNPKPFEDLTYKDIDKTFSVNVGGFFKVLQYLVPKMKEKKSGYILAISSIYGHISRKGRLPYSMSKHALNGMVKTLALEFGPYNIKVNAVSPGFVETVMTSKNNSPEVVKGFIEKIPLGYMAKPDDIAKIVYFLCSPENNYITGQCLIADGGYTIGGFEK